MSLSKTLYPLLSTDSTQVAGNHPDKTEKLLTESGKIPTQTIMQKLVLVLSGSALMRCFNILASVVF